MISCKLVWQTFVRRYAYSAVPWGIYCPAVQMEKCCLYIMNCRQVSYLKVIKAALGCIRRHSSTGNLQVLPRLKHIWQFLVYWIVQVHILPLWNIFFTCHWRIYGNGDCVLWWHSLISKPVAARRQRTTWNILWQLIKRCPRALGDASPTGTYWNAKAQETETNIPRYFKRNRTAGA